MARGVASIARPASVRKIDRAKPQAAPVDSETPPGLGPGLEGMLAGGEPLWPAPEARTANRPPKDVSAVEATPKGRIERELGIVAGGALVLCRPTVSRHPPFRRPR